MANVDKPDGFRPVRHLAGGEIRTNVYRKEASTIIGIGDPVVLTGSSSVKGTNNADVDGMPLIDRAAAGSGTITGVVVHIEIDSATDPATHTKHMAAADTGKVHVVDDPDVIFEIQEDGTMVVGDVGEGADIVIGDADTTTGRSIAEIDSTDAATGDQLRIMRLADRPDNELGANARWEVLINEHSYRAAQTMI